MAQIRLHVNIFIVDLVGLSPKIGLNGALCLKTKTLTDI